jgi:hypothetical protein
MTHPGGSLFGVVAFGIVSLAASVGCDGVPPSVPPTDGGLTFAVADAGRDPVTRCCRLDNARGERLDYKCSAGEGFDVGYLEGRGYRCWLAE